MAAASPPKPDIKFLPLPPGGGMGEGAEALPTPHSDMETIAAGITEGHLRECLLL